jgi:EpsI family protein
MLRQWAKFLVPAFLLAQAALVHVSLGSERPPLPPALSEFPGQLNQWTVLHEDPIDPDILQTLGADRLLSRTYKNNGAALPGNGAALPVSLLVVWFQSQRAGASQPHSPKVCLPASGWKPESSGEMSIATAAGAITVNRYVVAKHRERAVVLYWYQNARGVTAGEWASKFFTVVSALEDRRTDLALVRVVVEGSPGDSAAEVERAAGTAAEFARGVYPVLRAQLPR